MRREMIKFYFKFCTTHNYIIDLLMVLMVVLFYNFIFRWWFIALLNMYLIPQIIHSVHRGQMMEFDKIYIFMLLASRSFVPVNYSIYLKLYFRGCPENFLGLKSDFRLCSLIVVLVAL